MRVQSLEYIQSRGAPTHTELIDEAEEELRERDGEAPLPYPEAFPAD